MRADDAVSQSLQLAAEQLTARQPQRAIDICQQAIVRFPDDAKIHYLLAIALKDAKKPREAIDAYMQAVRLNPDFFEAYNNLGTLLIEQKRFDEAINALSEAIRLRPDLASHYANLSNALRDNWQLEDALAAAKTSLDLNPGLPEAHAGIGAAMLMLGRFEEAIAACRTAIQLKPELPAAHLNLALAELVTGNLERGWPDYLWWMRCPEVRARLPASVPLWDGTRIDGKTILLYSDQGFGDAIHFIRYAPMVADLGARIVVECPPALLPLFRHCAGADVALATDSPLPHCDYQCALASLPALFNTTLRTIPAPIPYLTADSNTIEAWRKRIASTKDTMQIGLAWAGRPENRNDRNRSIAGDMLSPLANVSGVRFHSLQKSREVIPSLVLSNWSELLSDFAETAGLIVNLDLIISVDTAVAHLAGAMGKPVWLLVPFPPEWRWMLDRTDSPWYPTMRLFRQKTPGDWGSVIQTVAGELAALAGSGLGNSIK